MSRVVSYYVMAIGYVERHRFRIRSFCILDAQRRQRLMVIPRIIDNAVSRIKRCERRQFAAVLWSCISHNSRVRTRSLYVLMRGVNVGWETRYWFDKSGSCTSSRVSTGVNALVPLRNCLAFALLHLGERTRHHTCISINSNESQAAIVSCIGWRTINFYTLTCRIIIKRSIPRTDQTILERANDLTGFLYDAVPTLCLC